MDLGSLFEDGEIPPKEPEVVEPMETSISSTQMSQEEFLAAEPEMDAQSSDVDAADSGPSPTIMNSQPNVQASENTDSQTQSDTPINLRVSTINVIIKFVCQVRDHGFDAHPVSGMPNRAG